MPKGARGKVKQRKDRRSGNVTNLAVEQDIPPAQGQQNVNAQIAAVPAEAPENMPPHGITLHLLHGVVHIPAGGAGLFSEQDLILDAMVDQDFRLMLERPQWY